MPTSFLYYTAALTSQKSGCILAFRLFKATYPPGQYSRGYLCLHSLHTVLLPW
jgi:hypothetical protein